jgi:hypothetical protein
MYSISNDKSNKSEIDLFEKKTALVEWINFILVLNQLSVDNFFFLLENGCYLCELANYIIEEINKKSEIITSKLKINIACESGSSKAMDNISNFINWCNNAVKIKNYCMFETNDLLLSKNSKNIIICLIEVARFANLHGLWLPTRLKLLVVIRPYKMNHFQTSKIYTPCTSTIISSNNEHRTDKTLSQSSLYHNNNTTNR